MGIVTFEGFVDHGQIRLKTPVHLPDKTKVYIVVPEIPLEPVAHIASPRLAHAEQVVDFKMEVEVSEETSNATL